MKENLNVLKWENEDSIKYVDAVYGEVQIYAYGDYSYKVTNQNMFEKEYLNFKTINDLDVEEYIKHYILETFNEVLSKQQSKNVMLLPNSISKQELLDMLNTKVINCGFVFISVNIISIKLSTESQSKINELSKKLVLEEKNMLNEINERTNTKKLEEIVLSTDNSYKTIKKRNKDKNKKLIIVSLVIFGLMLVSLILILLFSNHQNQDLKIKQTYKRIYATKNQVYYSNNEEKIYSFYGYQDIDRYFYHNVSFGQDSNSKYFLIDINNKYIVKPGVYDYVSRVNEKNYYVTKDNKKGVINYKGDIIIPVEYQSIDYYIDNDVEFFIAIKNEKEEKFLFSSNGTLITKTNEEISKDDITGFYPICSKCIETILYKEKLYNTSNGDILLDNIDGTLYYNFYYKDNKLTIYNEKYKVKKVINDFKLIGFETKDDGYILANGTDKDLYLDKNLKLIDAKLELESEDKNFIKKNGFTEIKGGNYHVLKNKSKYITKIDEKTKSIIIYDRKGKKLKSISIPIITNVKQIYSLGNYLVVNYGIDLNVNVFDFDGNLIVQNVQNVTLNKENNIIQVIKSKNEYILLSDDFKLEFNGKYQFTMYKDGFLVYDETNNKLHFYNLKGMEVKTLNNIVGKIPLVDDCILYTDGEGINRVFNKKTGTITFEYKITESNNSNSYYMPYGYYEDDIGVIETDDGIYSLEGKKLIEKK